MLKFLDKYEIYLYLIIALFVFFPGIYFLFFSQPFDSETGIFKKILILILTPLFSVFLFGGFVSIILRFIGHLVDHHNLNNFIDDIDNNAVTQHLALIFKYVFLIGSCVVYTIVITKMLNFLLIDFGFKPNFLNLSDYPIILFFTCLALTGMITGISFLLKVNPLSFIVSLFGLLIFLPNIFSPIFNEGYTLIEPFDKLLVTVKIFFGLLFLILPWLFDRSYRRIE
jgi:hypothetical protein